MLMRNMLIAYSCHKGLQQASQAVSGARLRQGVACSSWTAPAAGAPDPADLDLRPWSQGWCHAVQHLLEERPRVSRPASAGALCHAVSAAPNNVSTDTLKGTQAPRHAVVGGRQALTCGRCAARGSRQPRPASAGTASWHGPPVQRRAAFRAWSAPSHLHGTKRKLPMVTAASLHTAAAWQHSHPLMHFQHHFCLEAGAVS